MSAIGNWTPWFAWWPVWTGERWRWFVMVYRCVHGTGWAYAERAKP